MEFHSLIPELTVTDLERTKAFCMDVLQFQDPFGRGIHFEMTVSDVDGIYTRVLDAGIKPFREMKVSHYRNGDEYIVQKEFLVQDPDGYLLRFTD